MRWASIFLIGILLFCATSSLAESTTTVVSEIRICKAAISVLMGKDIQIISGKATKDAGVYHIWYIRPSDKTRWGYLCKFQGSRLIWAGAEEPSNPRAIGRWRTHPQDEIITFSLTNDVVTINMKYSDGSGHSKQFKLSDIK